MKYYRLARQMKMNSTLLDQLNYDLINFSSGRPLPSNMHGPLLVELDEEFIDGEMATLYMLPAFIARKALLEDLRSLELNNIETHPVEIHDRVNDKVFSDYVVLNIIGRVACADMNQSEYHHLGANMNLMNRIVIDASKTQGQELFLLDEDTHCIVINERVYKALAKKNYDDLYFEELPVV